MDLLIRDLGLGSCSIITGSSGNEGPSEVALGRGGCQFGPFPIDTDTVYKVSVHGKWREGLLRRGV